MSAVAAPTREGPVEVDGSLLSGSGSIVRQAAAYAALTRRAVRVVNARARRPNPGLRRQHLLALEAVRDLVGGRLEGAVVGSRQFVFEPGATRAAGRFCWDVGSAGSATAVALAVLPVLACRGRGVEIEVRGGLFQDFAPSVFHLEHVMAPLLAAMGFPVSFTMLRPGYLPRGEGVLRLVAPPAARLRPLVMVERGELRRVWGVALASHLDERGVTRRMAGAAREVLASGGIEATIEERSDDRAIQPGAAFALFAEFSGECRLGADGIGAPRRRAEGIGQRVARQLLDEIGAGGSVDRFTTDQLIPFAALADGTTSFRIPKITEHLETAAWLASLFLGVDVRIDESLVVTVAGKGMPGAERASLPGPR